MDTLDKKAFAKKTFNRTQVFKVFEPFLKGRADVRAYLEGLDDLNLLYFSTLIEQEQERKKAHAAPLKKLYDGKPLSVPAGEGALNDVLVPTAVAPQEWLKYLPYVTTRQLAEKKQHYAAIAAHTSLWIKKTQGGGGTSILRKNYLAKLKNIPAEKVHLGSKGTDLYVNLPSAWRQKASTLGVSLAEVQILQSLLEVKAKKYAQVFFQDIVSAESQGAVKNLWNKPCALDPAHTYENISKVMPQFHHHGETFQSVLPTLDDSGHLSLKRLAPGGHAFFAFEALLAAFENKHPRSKGPLVSVIGNGEDLGSSPDPMMVGWMIDNQIPIVMITTEKTEIDLKGGQIALEKDGAAIPHICLVERAQAQSLKQVELFEDLGLKIKKPGQVAFFNTNVALFNYDVLPSKMKKIAEKVGREEVLKLISPTLIENKKTQKDDDGVTRPYHQLEGAMGSTLLNLDKAWRHHFGQPFVHFINVERENRSQFFSPVKTAFDFFMLFYSDRFSLDPETLRIKNHRPDRLPDVALECAAAPEYYAEADQVLKNFEGAKILDLDQLKVNGKVSFKNKTLRGVINIKNPSADEIEFK